MTVIDNPIYQVLDALWDLLEADALFTLAVPSMNRIKYTSTVNRNPDLDNSLNEDFPCVRIRQVGMRPRLHRTSNSSMIELKVSIEVFTGDRRFATLHKNRLNDVEFAIFKAMANWQTYLYDFTWNGVTFSVRYCRPSETKSDIEAAEIQFKQTGWKSIWLGDIDIWFATSDLTLTST